MYNRKALGAEDVEFTMPLRKEDPDEGVEGGGGNEDQEHNKTGEGDGDVEKEKEKAVLRGGADDILESLGIEADSLPGMIYYFFICISKRGEVDVPLFGNKHGTLPNMSYNTAIWHST